MHLHVLTSLSPLPLLKKNKSLAALWLHQVGHPPNVISIESHLACRSNPAHADLHSFAIRETERQDVTIKKRRKRRKREASPANQKCLVQVGPVLTCCHGDPNVRGEGGGVWPSGVCLSVCFCLCSHLKALKGQWIFQAAVSINNMKI